MKALHEMDGEMVREVQSRSEHPDIYGSAPRSARQNHLASRLTAEQAEEELRLVRVCAQSGVVAMRVRKRAAERDAERADENLKRLRSFAQPMIRTLVECRNDLQRKIEAVRRADQELASQPAPSWAYEGRRFFFFEVGDTIHRVRGCMALNKLPLGSGRGTARATGSNTAFLFDTECARSGAPHARTEHERKWCSWLASVAAAGGGESTIRMEGPACRPS